MFDYQIFIKYSVRLAKFHVALFADDFFLHFFNLGPSHAEFQGDAQAGGQDNHGKLAGNGADEEKIEPMVVEMLYMIVLLWKIRAVDKNEVLNDDHQHYHDNGGQQCQRDVGKRLFPEQVAVDEEKVVEVEGNDT